jgi:hypothetical protein
MKNWMDYGGRRIKADYDAAREMVEQQAEADEERANMIGAMKAVAEGGGIWVGIQEGGLYNLVLFNSPLSGSTLALPTTEITAEAVRLRIEKSDREFRKRRQ